MKTMTKSAVSALAFCAMAGQSWAGGVCARPDEAMALKTASMQQQLMVAALYCDDTGLYNRFVVSFQRELQDSDAALLAYFQRANGRAGTAQYHSYKTSLANNYSLQGLHGMPAYCTAAKNLFDAALNAGEPRSLASFIANQSATGTGDEATCDETVAGGSSEAPTRVAANRPN